MYGIAILCDCYGLFRTTNDCTLSELFAYILADSYNSSCPRMQRTKVISDLLISVSKAERQEARLKVRQDSLRLGNVGVIRYCISCFTLLYL